MRSGRSARTTTLCKLTRCALPVAAAVFGSARVLAAGVTWTGGGDGTSWTDPNNWTAPPSNTSPGDDLTFGDLGLGGGTVGTVQLLGNELANSLAFDAGFTLDPPASTNTLTLTSGDVSVSDAAAIMSLFAQSGGAGSPLLRRGGRIYKSPAGA